MNENELNAPPEAPATNAAARYSLACIPFALWMLAVMLLSYILFNGPVMSSVIKRIDWFVKLQNILQDWFAGKG